MRSPLRTVSVVSLVLAAAPATAASAHDGYFLFGSGERGVSMSGSTDDLRRVRDIRHGNEPLLVVHRGSSFYVVRDAETLRRAEAILAPEAELGRKQGALGAQQGKLGARQGMLGAQQAQLASQQFKASPQRIEELARQQREIGRQQEELGRQQDILGHRQRELGEEQERVSKKADAELDALIDDAMKRGVATREN